jgi:hypothetical protein
VRSSRSGSASENRGGLGRRWLIVAYVAVVFGITLAPIPPDAVDRFTIPGADKWVHAAMIGGFALLLYWRPGPALAIGWAAGSFLAAAALAGIIELAQEPLPYRSGDWRDFGAGLAGALAAIMLAAVWRARGRRRRGSGRGE